ncbi:carbohydrate ABC transporter membrane protein 1, CUT1 family [Faunimonas pinastri]|uniref:Carbohydrate ABC transporter membrane protein 1, CUT1 family n=1 Tax=Faunimonas pinastri TaxID=1855383 RepID=A0A1H9IFF9_9HYPH|nr:sugar ABC transporter permease [Faunimonas pinastri]SEQ73350.1 carbohydrate ABC transporter membrane protein 1, CUT1 family [Faunimonas pinastri]
MPALAIRNASSKAVLLPTVVVMIVCFYGSILWTIYISFTRSGMLPSYSLQGVAQYVRLFHTARWHTAFANMFIFGGLYIVAAIVLGTLLAILMDQQIRLESVFRTIFLYPLAMSFIVTGLAWQWFLNPTMGLQHFVRSLGWESFTFNWIVDRNYAIYTLVFAAIWHGTGLIMAIMLAGLRGIDSEIWRAVRVEGIPRWRAYLRIVIPMLRPLMVTCVVLLAIDVVKSYDLVIAMTKGGPGTSTDLPAKFVVDMSFERANIGLASAGAVIMLIVVLAAVGPYLYFELGRKNR